MKLQHYKRQRIILIGGPYDGAIFMVPAELELPAELTFRQYRTKQPFEAIYVKEDEGWPVVIELFKMPSARYCFSTKGSTLLQTIGDRDKRIGFLQDEYRKLSEKFRRAELRLTRIEAGKKAAETRRKMQQRKTHGKG